MSACVTMKAVNDERYFMGELRDAYVLEIHFHSHLVRKSMGEHLSSLTVKFKLPDSSCGDYRRPQVPIQEFLTLPDQICIELCCVHYPIHIYMRLNSPCHIPMIILNGGT